MIERFHKLGASNNIARGALLQRHHIEAWITSEDRGFLLLQRLDPLLKPTTKYTTLLFRDLSVAGVGTPLVWVEVVEFFANPARLRDIGAAHRLHCQSEC
ncbi:hypothetical protein L479_03008 [Exiguobacterium sp. S17]|nr:hypothetical protein L479_03008 [Exiguobacterium sp. S17]